MEQSLVDIWNAAFPETFSISHFLTIALRLATATFFGGLIGLQRQRQHKSAGLRTHMLVALGSALFILIPLEMDGMAAREISRVIQGVATGIGFLGGGAIIKFSDSHMVKGLTSAAAIWLTAGLGMTVALGQIWTSILIVLLAWFVLAGMGKAERYQLLGGKARKKHASPDSQLGS